MTTRLTILLLFIATLCTGQNKIGISVYQDARLLLVGDAKRGYGASTLDVLAQVKLQGSQLRNGYFFVAPQFEFANIEGDFYRYSIAIGHAFNDLLPNDLELSVALDGGSIDRFGKNLFSLGGFTTLSYKLNDTLKLSVLGQVVERKDLTFFYTNETEIRFSGFIGIEVNIFKVGKRDREYYNRTLKK